MATTTHGLPYPLGTDRVMDGDNVIQALAQALDPVPRATVLAAAAGWAAPTDVRLFKLGALCMVHFQVLRTGVDIVAPAASSNITDVVLAGSIPADMIPAARAYGATIHSAAVIGAGRVNGTTEGAAAGQPTIATLVAGTTIPSGSLLDFDCFYLLY